MAGSDLQVRRETAFSDPNLRGRPLPILLGYGITGSVQEWFASYLSSRTQFVQIECSRSSLRELNCGVPQGSVLGPLLYVLYSSPVADIIKRHNLTNHRYADDTQLYK